MTEEEEREVRDRLRILGRSDFKCFGLKNYLSTIRENEIINLSFEQEKVQNCNDLNKQFYQREQESIKSRQKEEL